MAPAHLIQADNVGEAWVHMAGCVLGNGGEVRNLLITIADPASVNSAVHLAVEGFCSSHGLLAPKHVAYTIFPQSLARRRTAPELFAAYNRRRGFFDRVRKRRRSWGTYFRRMTCYEGPHGSENQLGQIIDAINSRQECYRAAYTVVILRPGGENVRPLGAPCLNYLAIQMEPGDPRTISLLAVYRNHDVVGKAYGNFVGLGWLLEFLCRETGSSVGRLTCLSSRAYVDRGVRALRTLLETLGYP